MSAILELPNARKITGGYGHSLAISNSGALYAWGLNEDYQVGNGSNSYVQNPVQIGTETNWIDIACGASHSLALNSLGDVYAWGRNVEQQCGIEGGEQISTPTKITFPEVVSINKISACGNYSLFSDILFLKKVYGCGLNSYYLLSSDNLDLKISTPTHMSDFDNATIISAGPELCAAVIGNQIKVRGIYDFSWSGVGNNYDPIKNTIASFVPESSDNLGYLNLVIGNKFLLALKKDRSIWGYTFGPASFYHSGSPILENSSIGYYGVRVLINNSYFYPNNNILAKINDSIKFVKIACGLEHVLLIDEDSKLYSWGGNEFNQLARQTVENNDTNIVEITGYAGQWSNVGCGNYHSLAILNS